jgi:hypothetical protein
MEPDVMVEVARTPEVKYSSAVRMPMRALVRCPGWMFCSFHMLMALLINLKDVLEYFTRPNFCGDWQDFKCYHHSSGSALWGVLTTLRNA